jgi:hypothetical protein
MNTQKVKVQVLIDLEIEMSQHRNLVNAMHEMSSNLSSCDLISINGAIAAGYVSKYKEITEMVDLKSVPVPPPAKVYAKRGPKSKVMQAPVPKTKRSEGTPSRMRYSGIEKKELKQIANMPGKANILLATAFAAKYGRTVDSVVRQIYKNRKRSYRPRKDAQMHQAAPTQQVIKYENPPISMNNF